jgi:hypothetical protein
MTAITYHDGWYDSRAADRLEELTRDYFERTFTVLNAFVEDPRHCLWLTEDVFRGVAQSPHPDLQGISHHLVKMVRGLHYKAIPVEGVSHESVLCWLIRETFTLPYEAIAMAMGLTREEVKENIAEVRLRLIG